MFTSSLRDAPLLAVPSLGYLINRSSSYQALVSILRKPVLDAYYRFISKITAQRFHYDTTSSNHLHMESGAQILLPYLRSLPSSPPQLSTPASTSPFKNPPTVRTSPRSSLTYLLELYTACIGNRGLLLSNSGDRDGSEEAAIANFLSIISGQFHSQNCQKYIDIGPERSTITSRRHDDRPTALKICRTVWSTVYEFPYNQVLKNLKSRRTNQSCPGLPCTGPIDESDLVIQKPRPACLTLRNYARQTAEHHPSFQEKEKPTLASRRSYSFAVIGHFSPFFNIFGRSSCLNRSATLAPMAQLYPHDPTCKYQRAHISYFFSRSHIFHADTLS